MLLIYFVYNFLIQAVYRIKNNMIEEFLQEDIINYIGRGICLLFIVFIFIKLFKPNTMNAFGNKLFAFLGDISYPLY